MAEFAARNTGAEVKLADGDGIVLYAVGKVVATFGHGADEHGDALVVVQALDVVAHAHNLRVEAECDLAAIRRQVIGDGVFDDLDELFVGCGRAYLVTV